MRDNILIAEFMGGIPSSVPNLINLPQTVGESSLFCVKGSDGLPSGTYKVERLNELKYNTSWDWLMPVVEKIESLGYEFFIVEDRIKIAHNTDHSTETIIDFTLGGSKRDATYQAVVEFIKWYNEQK